MSDPKSSLDATREEVTAFLATLEKFPAGLVPIAFEEKDINSEIAKALSALNIALLVMPPEPKKALVVGGQQKIIFFPVVELRVRIIRNVVLNALPITARQVRDIIMTELQLFCPTTPGVASPLELAEYPQQKASFPGQEIIDVIFNYQSYLYP